MVSTFILLLLAGMCGLKTFEIVIFCYKKSRGTMSYVTDLTEVKLVILGISLAFICLVSVPYALDVVEMNTFSVQ